MTERERIIERLRAVDLGGGSHESLSAIAKAIHVPAGGWTIVACECLRQKLVRLLGEADTAQGGRITDEVPEMLRKASRGNYEGSRGDVIDNIAQLIGCESRMTFAVIDALADKVEQALSEAYATRPTQKGHIDGFASAESWLSEHEDEMVEHGWVRLPKDADGKYIHIGDKMENNERVARIVLTDGSWEPSVYLEKLPNVLHEYFCNEISHYHAPTVEDVLTEFAAKLIERGELTNGAAQTIAEYAKRLKLAGSDAE